MKVMRKRVTIEEVVQYLDEDPKAAEKLLDFWENPFPGDQFIIKGQNKVRTLHHDNNFIEDDNGSYALYYETSSGMERVLHDDCHPLFDITQMIEVIQTYEQVQIQSVNEKWIVITDKKLFSGRDGEDLCSVLWKATKYTISNTEF